MKDDICLIIKNRRLELGYTLEYVGKKLGVAKSTIMRWENGETSEIKFAQLKTLCSVLHLNIKTFLDENYNEVPEKADVVLKREAVIDKIQKVKTIEDLDKIDSLIEVFLK